MCQALIDLNINHEEFKTIVNEKEKYEKIKENIRNTKSRDELSENSRILEKIVEMYRFNNICIFYFNSISINPKVHTITPIDEELFWVRMIDVLDLQKGLGTKSLTQ